MLAASKYSWLFEWLEWLYQHAEQRQPLGYFAAIVVTVLVIAGLVSIAIFWCRIQFESSAFSWRSFAETHCYAVFLIVISGYLANEFWRRLLGG